MHNRTKEATSCAMKNEKKRETQTSTLHNQHRNRGTTTEEQTDTNHTDQKPTETWTRNFTSTDLKREQEFSFVSQTPYDPHKNKIHRLLNVLLNAPLQRSENKHLYHNTEKEQYSPSTKNLIKCTSTEE